MKVKSLSRVQLLATPWTAAYQAPPSMGFSRQEYWSGVPLPSPIYVIMHIILGGFPGSSADKESTYNAEDPGSIPGSGRSPGEGIGYPLQYSWASLVDQLVKNPPAMQQPWVQYLDWDDPLKGKATHSSILAWRIP